MYVVYTSSHVAGSATQALYSHQHHRPGYGKRHVHVPTEHACSRVTARE